MAGQASAFARRIEVALKSRSGACVHIDCESNSFQSETVAARQIDALWNYGTAPYGIAVVVE